MSYIHFWDITHSELASIRTVKAKLRSGWTLYQLNQPYGGWGGVSNYTHVLVSSTDDILRLTERTFLQLNIKTSIDIINVDFQIVLLDVPYAEKDEAHAQGAQWMSHLKSWAIKPGDENRFTKWLPAQIDFGSCMQ